MAKRNAEKAARRRERWRELLRRWRASGLSQAAFCRRRGIPAWKLAWRKRRLGETAAAERPRGPADGKQPAPRVPFMPVGIVSPPPAFELELTLRSGRLLRFGSDVEATKLAAIVAALEAASAEGQAC